MITLLTLLPIAGGLIVLALSRLRQAARATALIFALAALAGATLLWARFDANTPGMQLEEWHQWAPALGIAYHVGVDGLGVLMVVLSALVVLMSLAASWQNERHGPAYFALALFLEAGLFGTFTALNFIHWFIYWELSLIPAFFLVRLWGGPGRARAAAQFFLYTMVGSVALLLSFLAMFLATGRFDFVELAGLAHTGQLTASFAQNLHWAIGPDRTAMLLFWGAFLGFAVKTAVVPFHTWLPATYAEAPSETTMLLTGAMSKMGVYGFLRILLPIFPQQMQRAQTPLLWMAVATIVLPAFAAWAQKDLKRTFAYSSINHLGYCILGVCVAARFTGSDPGLATEKAAALTGVLLQVFSHGLTAAALFWFLALLERRSGGVRGLDAFGGLRRVVPVFAGLMGITIFASLGLPGLNGFPGEFLIFKGAFPLAPWAASLSVLGLLMTAVFLLTVIQKVFSGPVNARWEAMPDLTTTERFTLAPAIALMFVLGFYPQLITGMIHATVTQWIAGGAFLMLAWTIYLSFAGALAARLAPSRMLARVLALITAVATLAVGLTALVQWNPGQLLTVADVPWIPQLGISYHLAADGISLTLVLLTGIAATAGILFSWNIDHRTQEFFAFYLVLIGGVYGVFLSFDLFLLFVFYEIAIIPKYFLIAIWGSASRDGSAGAPGSQREYAAMKLALYSFAGSALVLAGMVAAWSLSATTSGTHTMSLEALAHASFPVHFQMWAFPLVFIGFAVLAGMWPFHTWAPTGHAAAPTAASMLLAGVVMKLGAYGCLRVAMMLFSAGLGPWGFHVLGFGSWRDVFALLALIGIVYGATVALVQRDFKFIIGYSSVSHMGFVLLGLMTLTQIGLDGAVLQMFSHGVIAGLLFAVVGRMVYDRTHTRQLSELSPMRLAHAIPFAAVTFTLAAMASIGLPGFSGFVAEFQVLIGTWKALPWMTTIAGIGILVGIAFTWRALTTVFFGETMPGARDAAHALPPITVPEKLGAVLLLAATLIVGLHPQILTNLILPSLNSPLFEGLRQGGWR